MGGKTNWLHTANLVFAPGHQGKMMIVPIIICSVKMR